MSHQGERPDSLNAPLPSVQEKIAIEGTNDSAPDKGTRGEERNN